MLSLMFDGSARNPDVEPPDLTSWGFSDEAGKSRAAAIAGGSSSSGGRVRRGLSQVAATAVVSLNSPVDVHSDRLVAAGRCGEQGFVWILSDGVVLVVCVRLSWLLLRSILKA